MSVQKNIHGPIWPLGFIAVPTPGTPVNIMNLVDPNNTIWNPNQPTPPSTSAVPVSEYAARAAYIWVQAVKTGSPWTITTGNIYVCMTSGGKADPGGVIAVCFPGNFLQLPGVAAVKNVFNPYEIFLDADVAGEGAIVNLGIF